VSIDERPIALPKLYGAPAYARPPAPVEAVPRPFDLDELPLEVYQTEDQRDALAYITARTYEVDGSDLRRRDSTFRGSGPLRARPFSLRAMAGRLLGGE
jgi:hypothetical protein